MIAVRKRGDKFIYIRFVCPSCGMRDAGIDDKSEVRNTLRVRCDGCGMRHLYRDTLDRLEGCFAALVRPEAKA